MQGKEKHSNANTKLFYHLFLELYLLEEVNYFQMAVKQLEVWADDSILSI